MSAPITAQAFRDAMARICAPVHVITSDGPSGRGGFTATAVSSVTDDPPMLLVCMNRTSKQSQLFIANGGFCVNVLAGGQSSLARVFAGGIATMEHRYAAAQWRAFPSGQPALVDALASFDCRLFDVREVGTHRILFGMVRAVTQGPADDSLLFLERDFHQLPRRAESQA